MYGFLLALLVLDGIFLAIVVLLQAGKGGGLAAMGGGVTATEGILAGRQATTVLTRATWTAGGIFMGLALILSILSSRSEQPRSILLDDLRQTAPAPEPILPGLPGAPPTVEPGSGTEGGGILPPTGSPDGGPEGT
jgi:preprotein translocase subunit SecG